MIRGCLYRHFFQKDSVEKDSMQMLEALRCIVINGEGRISGAK